MEKRVVYFNSTKTIDGVSIHFNSKLDGTFAEDVARSIKEVAKKMGSKVDLKNPKDYYYINVYIYPSKKLFSSLFASEIEKRIYKRKTNIEDLYIIEDSEGNFHVISPRGLSNEKIDSLKKVLVIKVMGEFLEEKDKKNLEVLLKALNKPKEEEKEEEKEELEEETEEQEASIEELEQAEEEEQEEIALEEDDELSEEELDEIIATELAIEDIDEKNEDKEKNLDSMSKVDADDEKEEAKDEEKNSSNFKSHDRLWLEYGWYCYLSGKLKEKKNFEAFANHISKNGIKKLKDLAETKIFAKYEFSKEYAAAIVDFVISTFGTEKFTEFYEAPEDLEKIFGIKKKEFDARLKAFVYSNYTMSEMQMAVDERSVVEITELHFENNGGVIVQDLIAVHEEKDKKIIE